MDHKTPQIPTSLDLPKGETHPKIFPTPKRPFSYKDLRRTLYLNKDDGSSIKMFNAKRIHLRKVLEIEREDQEEAKALEKTHRTDLLKKGLLKGLAQIQIYSLWQNHWLQDLKHSQNLTKISCEPYFHCPVENITALFRRINKNLQEIEYISEGSENISYSENIKISRALGRLRKLKAFQGNGAFNKTNQKWARQEFQCLHKYFSRLPKLENFECKALGSAPIGLWRIMRAKTPFQRVTKVSMDLCQVNFESQFFNFQIFPNLKELEIQAKRENYLNYPEYGPSIIEAFKKLDSLQNFDLKLSDSSQQIHFLFEVLLELPQLLSLSFEIDSLEPEYWNDFLTLIQNQTNLISLSLTFPGFYRTTGMQDDFTLIQNLLASLSFKPKLQYLSLQSSRWPLQELFNGFEKMFGTAQLKSLQLKVLSHWNEFISHQAINHPFRGLRKFLLLNKHTLSDLSLDIPLIEKPEFNEPLCKAISQLTELRRFALGISTTSLQGHQKFDSVDNDAKDFWNPKVDTILLSLKNLEILKLDFDHVVNCPSKCRKWMSNSFRVLPLLKNLRELEFFIPQIDLAKTESDIINSALNNLGHVVSVKFLYGLKEYSCSTFKEILKTMEKITERQSRRVNLSF